MNNFEASPLLLDHNFHIQNPTPHPKPQSNTTVTLEYAKEKVLDQMSKNKFPATLDKLSLFDEDLLQITRTGKTEFFQKALKYRKLTENLKQLKSLKHLDINLCWFSSFDQTDFLRLFEFLKRLKNLSIIHFSAKKYASTSSVLSPEHLQALHQCIRRLNLAPKTKIKLSLCEAVSISPNFNSLLINFTKSKNFSSASLIFTRFLDISKIQEWISPLKKSKSLTKLSLTLDSCFIEPPTALQDLLLSLTEMKSLKELRITLRPIYKYLAYSDLKGLIPSLKKLGKVLKVELVIDQEKHEEYYSGMGRLEWFLFVRSVRNLNCSNTINLKYLGKKEKMSGYIPMFLVFLLVIFIRILDPVSK